MPSIRQLMLFGEQVKAAQEKAKPEPKRVVNRTTKVGMSKISGPEIKMENSRR